MRPANPGGPRPFELGCSFTQLTDEDTLINPDGNVVPQERLLLAGQGVVEQGRNYDPLEPSPSKGRLLL